jgi:hypothetical protein
MGSLLSLLIVRQEEQKMRCNWCGLASCSGFRLSELGGVGNRELDEKKLAFAIGILTLGIAASTAARADYAVAYFKHDGTCRAWQDSKAAPLAPGWKYHWVGLKSWQEAESKKHYAFAHHWCKTWQW